MMLKRRKAQNLIEYVLIGAVVIAAVVTAHSKLKSGVEKSLENAEKAMTNATDKLPDLLK